MTPRQKTFARMAELGATYDEECRTIDSPDGYKFTRPDLHSVYVTNWQGALEDLSEGVTLCLTKDCDVC